MVSIEIRASFDKYLSHQIIFCEAYSYKLRLSDMCFIIHKYFGLRSTSFWSNCDAWLRSSWNIAQVISKQFSILKKLFFYEVLYASLSMKITVSRAQFAH